MKNRNYVIVLSVFCFISAKSQMSENIDRYIKPLLQNKDFAGVILISKNDSILHLKGYGSANLEWEQKHTENSVFHIASLTKQFTAAAMLIAEQKGLLSVTETVSKYLPDFPNGNKITIEHLLSQRSGIPDYNELVGYSEISLKEVSLQETIDWFKFEDLLFEPGTEYQYSNSNFVLAAKILEVASGMKYNDFLSRYIFKPLAMDQTGNFTYSDIVPFRATGYDSAPQGLQKAAYYNKSFKIGSGSLYSSATDLYKWDRALYTNIILTQESREKLFTDNGNNYGLGWGVYHNDEVGKFVAHDGKAPGFFAYMKRYMHKDKIGIIILSNINSGIMNNMKSDITDIVFGRNFPVYEPYKIEPTPENLKEYTGKYDFPPKFNFTIVEENGELYFQWMDTPFLQYLTPVGENKFLMRSRYDYLIFNRDKTGKIQSVSYKQSGDTTLCKKL